MSDSARLTGWIAEARRGPAGAARSWLAAYLKLPRPPAVPLYPDLDPETFEPRWPEALDVDARLAQPDVGLHWVTRDDLEPGRVVPAAPLRFATDVAHARCTFSRGPRGRYSAVDAAAALAEEVAAAPDSLRSALNPASRRRLYLCEDALRRGVDPTPTAREAAAWLDDALERLLAAAGVTSGLGKAADAILARLRAWGEAVSLVALPRTWSFADPPRAVDVPPDEVAPIGMPTRFDTSQGVAGCLVLTAFGLTGGPGGDRPARGVVSAGPPPQGFEAFRAELDEARSGPPTPTPQSAAALEALAASLDAWHTAAARGYLEADAPGHFPEVLRHARRRLPRRGTGTVPEAGRGPGDPDERGLRPGDLRATHTPGIRRGLDRAPEPATLPDRPRPPGPPPRVAVPDRRIDLPRPGRG